MYDWEFRGSEMFQWRELTLKTKTALILILSTWVSASLIGLASRSAFEYLVHRHIDIELTDDAKDFHAILDKERFPFTDGQITRWNRRLAIHPTHRIFVHVIDEEGKALWSSITAPPPFGKLDNRNDSHQTVGQFRVVHQPIELRFFDAETKKEVSRKGAMMQVGCAMDLAKTAMRELDKWILPVVVWLLVVVPPLAWLISGWLLLPLRRLTKETDAVQINEDRWISRSKNGDDIDRLAITVNGLLQRTRESIQHNEDWLANAAHQLRGPLAAIMSNIEVCADRARDQKTGEMLEKVSVECNYLKKIVNQLLLLGETNSDRRESIRVPVAWDRQVLQAVDFFEALAEEKGVLLRTLAIDAVAVVGNPDHLRFIIQNVLDNAIKYTSKAGTIVVELRAESECKEAVLRVQDTGIGISQEDQKRIGQRFFRSNSGRNPAETPRGSGLGLSIVLNIVHSMQGSFDITSELGRGTLVTVRLPFDASTSEVTERQAIGV
jgi:signal transduction histidine kinase